MLESARINCTSTSIWGTPLESRTTPVTVVSAACAENGTTAISSPDAASSADWTFRNFTGYFVCASYLRRTIPQIVAQVVTLYTKRYYLFHRKWGRLRNFLLGNTVVDPDLHLVLAGLQCR